MSDKHPPAPEVYVDGLEGMLLGYPNSKLRFTTIDPSSEAVQPKVIPKITLVVPTGVLIQVARQLLNTFDSNKEALRTKIAEISANTAAMIAADPVVAEKSEKAASK